MRMVLSAPCLATIAVAALGIPGCAHPPVPATEVVTAVAVGPQGQPINGYHETPSGGTVNDVFDCAASPAAVGGDVYKCFPSVAGADVCWPATPDSLLCVDDPWDKGLHRATYVGALPRVQPTVAPLPFALLLDDGTRCRLRSGGAWGGRDDGYVAAYGCQSSPLTVLVKSGDDAPPAIDRSASLWTVKVGELGSSNVHFAPPETRTVSTAWFAGDSA